MGLRTRFSLSLAGGSFMIVIGLQLSRLRSPLNLTGWTDLVSGLAVYAGALVFYLRPMQSKTAASIVLLFSMIGWIPFLAFLVRIFAGQSLFGFYLVWLFLGPLLSMAGAVAVLIWKSIRPGSTVFSRP